MQSFDLGFRVVQFKDTKPGDIFVEHAGGMLVVAMKITKPDGKPGILTFHPTTPLAGNSRRHDDRDVAVVEACIVGPSLNAANLIERRADAGIGILMFDQAGCILRVKCENEQNQEWDVNLADGMARTISPPTGPFMTNSWSIVALRNNKRERSVLFQSDAG